MASRSVSTGRRFQPGQTLSAVRLFTLNVSGLEQTARFLPNKLVPFPLDAPSSQAGIRKPRGFDIRIGSRIKSQAKFHTAARRESSEDSMKRALLLLLIVVPALLVALGFAQTPAASINTDQTNLKGCLGGSEGNYTIVQDNTGHSFKITTSSVDLKPHLGHDVTLIGHKASGVSPAASDNSFAVTELNMISDHCAVAAVAPSATVSTPAETVSTPPATAVAPAATTSTVAEAVVTPAATAAPPAEIVVTPAPTDAPPAEVVVTPAPTAAVPAATVTTSSETASSPALRPRRRSETPAAPTTAPDVTASTSSATASTPADAATPPAAAANSSSEATASTPDAVATPPATPARRGALLLLIAFAVLVIVLGTMAPVYSRWRKRKLLERTGPENLSFNREESSDRNRSDQAGPRKAA
jgi:hypothetical protein